jgi:hypothetical protein
MTIDATPGDIITILVGQQPQLQVEGRDGCGAGGGGGYSGGAGTDDERGGGGGGSFDASDEGNISIRTQHGHGRVIIEAVF